jgi:hypothetical protein
MRQAPPRSRTALHATREASFKRIAYNSRIGNSPEAPMETKGEIKEETKEGTKEETKEGTKGG